MTEWIKCSDRLPDPFVDVLVQCISNDTYAFKKGDKYLAVDRYIIWNDDHPPSFSTDRFHGIATHWMPLPEGPKE